MGDSAAALGLTSVAQAAAQTGAQVAMAWLRRTASLGVEEKNGPRDLVSRADRDTEDAIVTAIRQARPDDGVLGEERGAIAGSSGVVWAVDPIDGTTNYLYGRPDWAVSVAALHQDDHRLLAAAVCEPMLDRVTTACLGGGTWSDGHQVRIRTADCLASALIELNLGREDQRGNAGAMIDALAPRTRDVRRGGSAAVALAQLATGRADAVWAPGLQLWDGAAGVLLVHEAGGMVGDLFGPTHGSWPTSGDVLAATPALWSPLRELLTPVYRS